MTYEQQQLFQNQIRAFTSLKSIQVLSALAFFKEDCGINDIAALTELPVSTIHRVLQEFVESGLAVKNGKKYGCGIILRPLFESITDEDYLTKASSAEMDRLNNLTKETIHLIIKENTDAVYLAKRSAQNQVNIRSMVGKRVPMYCTSGGKLLMAYQSKKWLDEYFEKVPLKKLTDYTIADREALEAEFEKIRGQGFAVDYLEHNPDVVCVAAPVFFSDGCIACTIGVATPQYRMDAEKMEMIIEQSGISAKAITEKLK